MLWPSSGTSRQRTCLGLLHIERWWQHTDLKFLSVFISLHGVIWIPIITTERIVSPAFWLHLKPSYYIFYRFIITAPKILTHTR